MPIADVQTTLLSLISARVPAYVTERTVTPETNFREQLDIDSLGLLSLAFEIESALGVDMFAYSERLAESRTVADLIHIARDAARVM
jgi:acyl carrier protein